MAPARAVTTVEAALAAADELGYPVALKAAGLERLARSESGGVALDLQDAEQLRGVVRAHVGGARRRRWPRRSCSGWCRAASRRSSPSRRTRRSARSSAFGLGGAFADAIADRPARSLPLTDLDAAELVASSRAAGASTTSAGTSAAVEDVLLRVGLLVDAVPEIQHACASTRSSSRGGGVGARRAHPRRAGRPLPDAVPLRRL